MQQSVIYQDILQEGEQRGEQTGALREAHSLVLRQLTRRMGELTSDMTQHIRDLSLAQLEFLSDALLDFTGLDDLVGWLQRNA